MEPKLFTAQEFSDLTGVPRGTLRRWKHEKKITPVIIGGATKPNYYSESQIPIAIQLFQMASKYRRENSSMNHLFSSEEDIKNMETSQNPTFDNHNHNDDREEEIPAVIPTDDDDADDDELIDPPIINATQVISLDGDDTVSLEERANRIRKLQADVERGIIQIGLELAAAKKEVGHGNWADWLKKEFAWSQRTASYFMAIAERFSNSHTYSNLKPSTLKAMLALPEGDEDAFIEEQAKSGKHVETQTAREVQASIKHWKQKNRHKEKQDSIPDLLQKSAESSKPIDTRQEKAANSTPIPVDDETDEVKGTYVNLTGKPANDVVADELNAQATKSPSPTKPTIDAQTPAVDAPRRINDAPNIEPNNNLSLQREKALEAIRELIITKAESATDLSALRNALTLIVEIIDTELSKN
jgi:hypothetical protein